MREVFEAQHREMIDIATDVLAAVDDCQTRRSEQLNKLRLALSKAVTAHCQQELGLFEAAAARMPDALKTRYHDELLKWRHDLIACNSEWPPERVWEDPAGFRAAYRPLVEALKARVIWEREAVYPIMLPMAA